MKLVKTTLLSSLSAAVKIATGFGVNKLVAVYVGPNGIALLGQMSNFIAMALAFSNGGINNGIVKYVAELHDDHEQRTRMVSTAIAISIVCALIISAVIIAMNHELAAYLLKDGAFASIFIVLGATMVFSSLQSSLLSILNGFKEVRKYIAANILGSLVGLLITATLIILYRLYGAMLALVVSQACVLGLTVMFVANCNWFRLVSVARSFDWHCARRLMQFSLMAIVSAIAVPSSQIVIRTHISDAISIGAAGLWQGVFKISDAYLMIVTLSLSVYYLPRLSELTDGHELRREILHVYRVVMPVVLASATLVYVFRELIIKLLYTSEFSAMASLFAWQLIGDCFKIASWLLGYMLVAKARTALYVVTEVAASLSYVLLALLLINSYGLIGVTYAYCANYVAYFILMLILFRRLLLGNVAGHIR